MFVSHLIFGDFAFTFKPPHADIFNELWQRVVFVWRQNRTWEKYSARAPKRQICPKKPFLTVRNKHNFVVSLNFHFIVILDESKLLALFYFYCSSKSSLTINPEVWFSHNAMMQHSVSTLSLQNLFTFKSKIKWGNSDYVYTAFQYNVMNHKPIMMILLEKT